MVKLKKIYSTFFLLSFVVAGCKTSNTADHTFHFALQDAKETNIHFNNTITESDSINVFINEYMYNGSGVGIGDFNNDGMADIFFGGSMMSSKLYLNKGDFKFEDVTLSAGLQTNQWSTGISVIDINSDGFKDIYVCSSHSPDPGKRKNQLFINDGKLHFTDQAAAYGLADTGYATQAAFFDYDKDDDLDMYLLNHRLYSHTAANNLHPKDTSGNSPAQDRLYRNEGIRPGQSQPVFREVSSEAGIKEDGYGLGVVITDANKDSWPDIYVANDYLANDLLWLNNGNGTFSNVISTSLNHQSYNSMGVDAADINNDLLPDLASLDMLPENNERKKMMLNATSQQKFDMQQRFGYEPTYMRNMLHLNNGNRQLKKKNEPFYSEIGQMAGVFETDWSWSVLMVDFDNDGWKDMHVTNGLAKDVTNNDYATFRNEQAHLSGYTFGGGNPLKAVDANTIGALRKEIDEYGSVKMCDYLFHNNGDLTFSNMSRQAGFIIPAISCGAAYGDLDNDGDLDLIINNINQEAFVWRNELRHSVNDSSQRFLSVQLKGSPGNIDGIGCKVTLYQKSGRQYAEQFPARGFSSSVDFRLHFGTGNERTIDSLQIQWPDGKEQWMKDIKTNQSIVVEYGDAKEVMANDVEDGSSPLFRDITGESGIVFAHKEQQNFDFSYHQPLPQRYSQLGPCIATGDVNGDGLTDFFVGGATNQPGKIFVQGTNGNFISSALDKGDKIGEDLGSVLFDADGDKDPDLLITGGSFEFGVAKYNQPRLYSNDGKGNFTLDDDALPVITDITKAASIADYDGDGDTDIFIGGRLKPQKYPQSPRSYILENSNGKFTDVTKATCSLLEFPGLIDAALFTDFNNDKKPDLIIAGEWTAIRFFKNENNKFIEVTGTTGLENMNGIWRSLQQADIDKDGDMDYIAGNMGVNNKYRVTPGRPMMLYAKDLDKNGYDELIPAYYIKDNSDQYKLFPALDRSQLAEAVPAVKKKYLLHKDYSAVNMHLLIEDFGADGWTILKCETFSTIWIENLGHEKFRTHALPVQAQLAPVNCIVADDVNGDGNVDLLMAGNEYQVAANTGRYDASFGLLLIGNGKGEFVPIDESESGIIIDGDTKDLKMIHTKSKGSLLLAAPNDSPLKTFLLNSSFQK